MSAAVLSKASAFAALTGLSHAWGSRKQDGELESAQTRAGGGGHVTAGRPDAREPTDAPAMPPATRCVPSGTLGFWFDDDDDEVESGVGGGRVATAADMARC